MSSVSRISSYVVAVVRPSRRVGRTEQSEYFRKWMCVPRDSSGVIGVVKVLVSELVTYALCRRRFLDQLERNM
jgi:hypothetical protein